MRGPRALTTAHLLCVCTAALAAVPGPRFLVTAPGIIRPGGNVTIGVELLEHGPSQITVKAEVLKMASNLTVSVLAAEGVFEKGSFKTLVLPSLPMNSADEMYELHVTGRAQDEILFSNSTRLSFETKRMSVFIQTDKALYKPKQEVKFRVVTLFSDFKPYKTSLNILIKDPKSNLIQQWLSQQNDLGVVSRTFQLSSHPILGDWSIQVQVNVKVTRSDGNQLTPEERRNNLVIAVTQRNYTEFWSRWDSRNQEMGDALVINYTVPQNGVFKIEFPILDDSSELQLKVVSRGQLVAVGKQNSTTFSLTPENSWAPKACIIVYYVEDDGEIINDVLKIPIQLVFKNEIKLFWSKANAEPSEKVSLRISVTQPESLVGIVAVDKSVNLMNASNDITMENVKVIIEKSDEFDILMTLNEINATGYQQTVLVPSEDGATVHFPVKPMHLGEIPITVIAISPTASDAITQKILVKAEGIEKSYSQTVLLDMTDNKPQSTLKTLSFSFPPDTVSGSERVQITAIGDILGPSINGLASLIRMPYGCGEQNMINFAPNIYVLDYLTKKRQLTDNLREKALSFMRQGYQRELLYQREDGSFSAFGNDDPSGSTWLSAFVLRCFLEADPYIDIDQNVLHRTYTWIKGRQKSNGEFWEPGRVIHSELQGGNKSPVTLTAYIVTSLLGYKKYQPNIDVQDSINFLESELSRGISDNYTLALITYALSSVGSPKAKEALNMLTWRAEQQGEMQFWVSSVSTLSESWQPRSLDIEVAAYALLSHFLQLQVSEGIPIMRWLSRQRNSLGGFASTQDTIVALKALSEFAALMNTERTNIHMTVMGPSSPRPVKFLVDTNNRLLLQTAELAVVQPTAVNISANGFGFAICQLNVIYNVKDLGSSRRRRSIENQEDFDLDVAVEDNKDDINHVNLNVCTR
ncbi:CD109 antigen [Tupaia chinensis]|uniref:CD109 antigen n=1 Tax=Tupaia chinensis TaxID=246437 RepID=L8Y763_TUPCH|nr:CD109 antigen [Tupaia chinensis]